MRSQQVIILEGKDNPHYSDLQVLKSAAGWYIGTIHTDDDGFQEPGSRDSGYYQTKEEAQQALDNNSFEPRLNP